MAKLAQETVEAYIKLIEEERSVHGRYKTDELIGWISPNGWGENHNQGCMILYSLKDTNPMVLFNKGIAVEQLKYLLKQNGLYVKEVERADFPPILTIRIL